MAGEDDPATATSDLKSAAVPSTLQPLDFLDAKPPARWRDYLLSALSVALMTMLGKTLQPWVGYPSIDLFYLVPVILAATLFGLRPGVATGVASGFAYNFFFLPPLHTFAVHDPQDVITASVLVLVAIVTSQLAGRVRAQAQAGEQSAKESAAIASFVSILGGVSDKEDTARTICSGIAELFGVEAVILDWENGNTRIAAATAGSRALEPDDISAAELALRRGEITGHATVDLPLSKWQFWPITGGLGTIAVVGIASRHASEPITPNRSRIFADVVDRAARAYERLRVEAESRHVTALRERDRLRATLLSSIGHDLRTPLTAVTAAAEALVSDTQNEDLVSTIRSEALRLGRFFDDLIDVTRIESGALAPRVEAVDLTDAVAASLEDVKLTLEGRPIRLDVPADLPLVRTDPNLLHHILINLLDNAAKFSPAGSEIALIGKWTDDGIMLSVADAGPGLPADREAIVFDTFTRLEGSDRTGGTGLGLAIVKGFAEALAIGVDAANRDDIQGACFTLVFPARMLLSPGPDE